MDLHCDVEDRYKLDYGWLLYSWRDGHKFQDTGLGIYSWDMLASVGILHSQHILVGTKVAIQSLRFGMNKQRVPQLHDKHCLDRTERDYMDLSMVRLYIKKINWLGFNWYFLNNLTQTLNYNWSTYDKCVTSSSGWTTACWNMINNITYGSLTTRAWTWILTFLVQASFISRTIWIHCTFWTTTY